MSKKKVLVIGGTYFLGRVFTLYSYNQYDLTLVNRGSYSMNNYPVKEIHFDRHNQKEWKKVHGHYDAIVDFCAYQQGDIADVFKYSDCTFDSYILISTVDVYKHGTRKIQDENSPLEDIVYRGEMGEYITGKIAVEKELEEYANQKNIQYTILRLGNLYGPFNYAPRETELIKRVITKQPLYHLTDAKARFQLVYVKDAAMAIQRVIDEKSEEHFYNILANVSYSYDDLNGILEMCDKVSIEDATIEEALASLYPTPYPIYESEQELYDGNRFLAEFSFTYSSLEDGLVREYKAIKNIYEQTNSQSN